MGVLTNLGYKCIQIFGGHLILNMAPQKTHLTPTPNYMMVCVCLRGDIQVNTVSASSINIINI